MRDIRSNNQPNKAGFTIVELMIATAVFSIVLLVASAGVIAIGRSYYKSLTATRVQEDARSVMDDVSRSLQFSSTDSISNFPTDGSPVTIRARCFGPDRYTYVLNQQVSGGNHALYRDTRSSQSTCNPGNFTGGTELLGDHMRLLQFDVSSSSPFAGANPVFTLNIGVAYGDNDLLSNYPDNAGPTTPPNGDPLNSVTCKSGIAGSNFCAVAGLETTVTSRVE